MPFDTIQYQIKAEPPPAGYAVFPNQNESLWHYAWSEPVRIKPGLKPYLQQFFATDPRWIPDPSTYIGWWAPLRDPVRLKPGLRASLQHYFEAPPRLLPTPNVTAVMHATEINNDIANIFLNVYTATPVAGPPIVSIVEVGVPNSPTSLREIK
jgi:hypothetical protein